MSLNKKVLKAGPLEQKRLKKKDSVIWDNNGQWAHPGKVTGIDSPNITMEGIPYPVFAVDAGGNQQLMMPGNNYFFPQPPVIEYPLDEARKGGQPDKLRKSGLPRGKTNKNIQSSINYLMMRNPILYGPSGKNRYLPKAQAGQQLDLGYHPNFSQSPYTSPMTQNQLKKYREKLIEEKPELYRAMSDFKLGVNEPGIEQDYTPEMLLMTAFAPESLFAKKAATSGAKRVAMEAVDAANPIAGMKQLGSNKIIESSKNNSLPFYLKNSKERDAFIEKYMWDKEELAHVTPNSIGPASFARDSRIDFNMDSPIFKQRSLPGKLNKILIDPENEANFYKVNSPIGHFQEGIYQSGKYPNLIIKKSNIFRNMDTFYPHMTPDVYLDEYQKFITQLPHSKGIGRTLKMNTDADYLNELLYGVPGNNTMDFIQKSNEPDIIGKMKFEQYLKRLQGLPDKSFKDLKNNLDLLKSAGATTEHLGNNLMFSPHEKSFGLIDIMPGFSEKPMSNVYLGNSGAGIDIMKPLFSQYGRLENKFGALEKNIPDIKKQYERIADILDFNPNIPKEEIGALRRITEKFGGQTDCPECEEMKKGGWIVGQEYDASEEDLKLLNSLGYKYEML